MHETMATTNVGTDNEKIKKKTLYTSNEIELCIDSIEVKKRDPFKLHLQNGQPRIEKSIRFCQSIQPKSNIAKKH